MKISVILEALTGSFETDFQRAAKAAQRHAKEIERSLLNAGKIGAAGLTVAVGAFGLMVKRSLDAADELGNLAEKTGISVEALSQLQFAAKQSDVELGEFESGLIKLNNSIADASKGTGSAAEAFRFLGVSVKDQDGNLRSSEQIFTDLAGAYASLGAGATKTAVTIDIFGRSGAALIPLLNQGADGIDRMRDRADQLGLTIKTSTAAAADEFDKNLKMLTSTFDGVAASAAERLAPRLVELSAIIQDPAFANGLRTIIGLGVDAVEAVARVVGKVGQISQTRDLEKLNREAAYLRDTIERKSIGRGFLEGFGRDVDAELQQAQARLVEIEAQIVGLTGSLRGFNVDTSGLAGPEYLVGLANGLDLGKVKTQGYAAAADGAAKAVRGAKGATDEWAVSLDAAASIQAEVDRMQSISNGLIEEAARLYEQTRTPLERYTAQLQRLDELSRTLGADGKPILDADTYSRAVAQMEQDLNGLVIKTEDAKNEMSVFAEQAARNMQDAFANFLFDPFDDGVKGMVRSFAKAIQQMAAERAAAEVFKAFSPSAEGGGQGFDWVSTALGAAFSFFSGGMSPSGTYTAANIPGRANGGRVMAGMPYIVGERQPELFVPDIAGTVVPSMQLGQAGGSEKQGIRIVNAFDQQVIADFMSSSSGEEVFLNMASRNGSKLRSLIGAGG